MKNLYIIGNGFDMYHGLDTKYQSFAKFLSKENNEIYELILTYYGLPDISENPVSDDEYNLWSSFELALADLDYEQVLEDKSDYAANPGSPDFRDRDWHSYQIEMELIIDKLTNGLISVFNSFILNVEFPVSINEYQIELEASSVFLNFNYTNTLERYYEILENNICYIHNKVKAEKSDIILGHGTDPENFKEEKVVPPTGLSDEEMQQWEEHMSDQFDLSYEDAKGEILSYYTHAFKNTQTAIDKNIDFFNSLENVQNIFVLGHSMSEVDIKYFEKIVSISKGNPNWVVSYHREDEKEKYLNILIHLGIVKNKAKQIKIDDLRKTQK
ncbi:bacteriophage abortive infection AbiH family protein [Algibacter sp. 2305UL17-15]|uniref:bacteriophage abortive infection AbiH family protein n=1 Tax=Algibacter sp. 2305UL17-15 TaxID=3231268 RepID=UPI00345B29DC